MYTLQQLFEGLECGHEFCTRCWKEYLTSKIMDEQKEVSKLTQRIDVNIMLCGLCSCCFMCKRHHQLAVLKFQSMFGYRILLVQH